MTSPGEFRTVLRGGRSRGAGGLVVHVRERDGGGYPRLGLVVPGGVGTAVERNRLKRRIRAAWRDLAPRAAGVDCVVVVRREATACSVEGLAGHLERCLRQLRVLAPSEAPSEAPGEALGEQPSGAPSGAGTRR
ncbi:MAG TPA: ribonuclease P protein component [Actinomycetota bacterium]|nr:ribonuclease P protein component [Actinomycetota bacterium]